jgi:hypothetical protein
MRQWKRNDRCDRSVARPREDGFDVAIEIYGCQLYGMSGDGADVGAEATARIRDCIRSNAEARNLCVGWISHLEKANRA